MKIDISKIVELSLKPFKELKKEYIGKEFIFKDFAEEMKERFDIEDKDIIYDEFFMDCKVQYKEDEYYLFKLKEEKVPYFRKKVITEIYQEVIAKEMPLANINDPY